MNVNRPGSNPEAAGALVAPPLQVCVVEDHADTRAALCLFLDMLGYRIAAADSVNAALEHIDTCDVLISDIGLPDGDGWELLRRLAPRPRYALAMSGYDSAADRARSKAAGYRHHLAKPVDLNRVEELLEEARRECAGVD